MSAASGFQPFPSNGRPVSADLKTVNPSLLVRGGGNLSGGFSEKSLVLMSRSPDLFAAADQTPPGVVEREDPAIGAGVRGLDVCVAVPVQAALPEKPASETVAVNRPEWLPAGWTTGIKVRTSGATAGARDKVTLNVDQCKSGDNAKLRNFSPFDLLILNSLSTQ